MIFENIKFGGMGRGGRVFRVRCAVAAGALSVLGFEGAPAATDPSYPTCSRESIYRLDKAVACWNKEDVGCAKLALERILGQQPGCAQALYLQSFVLEREGRHAEVRRLRERAEKLDPALKKFWEQRGKLIESTLLQSQEFSHFVLRFHRGEEREKAWRAVRYLNEAYNEMGSHFGAYPPGKIEVIVLATDEFIATWRSPYIGGFYDLMDGKVRVRVDEMPGGEEQYRRVCRHEFAHAFIYQIVSREMPMWFSEGSAEFYATRNTADSLWKEKILAQYRRVLGGQPRMTLEEIHKAIKDKKDPRRIGLGYYYSHGFCLYLGKERGESWIPRLLKDMQNGADFDAAFRNVIGFSADQAYEGFWRNWP